MGIISSQPLFNGFLFGKWQSAARRHRHLERRNAPVWVVKTLGSNETQSREISCHHGLATFRSEISPLRFASVEMTGVWGSVWGNLSLGMTVCCPPTSSSRAGERAGMGQGFWVLMKRRVERSPATMGLATFRSEISPLRFASVEMTGRGAAFFVICPLE